MIVADEVGRLHNPGVTGDAITMQMCRYSTSQMDFSVENTLILRVDAHAPPTPTSSIPDTSHTLTCLGTSDSSSSS